MAAMDAQIAVMISHPLRGVGWCRSDIMCHLAGAPLYAPVMPDGIGIRPIAVGEVSRRLTAKVTVLQLCEGVMASVHAGWAAVRTHGPEGEPELKDPRREWPRSSCTSPTPSTSWTL